MFHTHFIYVPLGNHVFPQQSGPRQYPLDMHGFLMSQPPYYADNICSGNGPNLNSAARGWSGTKVRPDANRPNFAPPGYPTLHASCVYPETKLPRGDAGQNDSGRTEPPFHSFYKQVGADLGQRVMPENSLHIFRTASKETRKIIDEVNPYTSISQRLTPRFRM